MEEVILKLEEKYYELDNLLTAMKYCIAGYVDDGNNAEFLLDLQEYIDEKSENLIAAIGELCSVFSKTKLHSSED